MGATKDGGLTGDASEHVAPGPSGPRTEMEALAARAALAPTGILRVAINLGNAVLAVRDESIGGAGGELRGLSVDLARELARRLDLPLKLLPYLGAGKVVEAVGDGAWDLAFLAADPARAAEIDFTPPYVIIEGSYLVREDSPLHANEEVDRPGIRVATATGSAYDLHLTRELRQAAVVRAPGPLFVVDRFIAEGLEVAAGVRQQLEADARRLPGLRLLPGRFMVINQAMALPRGRGQAFGLVRGFVEEMKASGFVVAALARHGVEGAALAPPAATGS